MAGYTAATGFLCLLLAYRQRDPLIAILAVPLAWLLGYYLLLSLGFQPDVGALVWRAQIVRPALGLLMLFLLFIVYHLGVRNDT